VNGCGIIYRCGYCGNFIDEQGNPYSPEETIRMLNGINMDEILLHGECCVYEQMQEKEYVTVTRDMALDAGDPNLEGQTWVW